MWHRSCNKYQRLEEKMTSEPTILQNEILLNLLSNRSVSWAMVKLCGFYKYVGLLV